MKQKEAHHLQKAREGQGSPLFFFVASFLPNKLLDESDIRSL